jgi:hypothetical protein
VLGRRDGLVSNQTGASNNLPGPTEKLEAIITKFANVIGLNVTDVVSLSGAHKLSRYILPAFSRRCRAETNVELNTHKHIIICLLNVGNLFLCEIFKIHPSKP